jgi:hypothetical protein
MSDPQHHARLGVGDGTHHTLLRMSTLGLPLFLHLFLQARSQAIVDLRVQLDRHGAPDELHALSQRLEAVREYGVPDPQAVQGVGDRTTIARASKALDALEIGDVQCADFLFLVFSVFVCHGCPLSVDLPVELTRSDPLLRRPSH